MPVFIPRYSTVPLPVSRHRGIPPVSRHHRRGIPHFVSRHRGGYTRHRGGYTPPVATQKIIPPLLYGPPVSRHRGGIPVAREVYPPVSRHRRLYPVSASSAKSRAGHAAASRRPSSSVTPHTGRSPGTAPYSLMQRYQHQCRASVAHRAPTPSWLSCAHARGVLSPARRARPGLSAGRARDPVMEIVPNMMIVLFIVLARNKLRIPLEGTYSREM